MVAVYTSLMSMVVTDYNQSAAHNYKSILYHETCHRMIDAVH